MKGWTQALSKAVGNSVTKLVAPKPTLVGGIPRDPLEPERLELEKIADILSSLYENLQWFLVTLMNFGCQYDYVHNLVGAVRHDNQSLVKYEESVLELQVECDSHAEEIKDAIDLCDSLLTDVTACIKRFQDRRELFQEAVGYQVKATRLETELQKTPNLTLEKTAERYRKKANELKATFKKQNTVLQNDVQELLRRARAEKAEMMCLFFRNQQVLARRLHNAYGHLQEPYANTRDQIASTEALGFQLRSGSLDSTKFSRKTNKSRRSQLPSAAQLFLLTHRRFDSSRCSEDMRASPMVNTLTTATSDVSNDGSSLTDLEVPSPTAKSEGMQVPILITRPSGSDLDPLRSATRSVRGTESVLSEEELPAGIKQTSIDSPDQIYRNSEPRFTFTHRRMGSSTIYPQTIVPWKPPS